MIDYSLRYGLGETLHLPRPIRTYFDSGSEEWNDCSISQKLLDIGYVTTMGYDIQSDITEFLHTHDYISEEDIKHSLAILITELIGKTLSFVETRFEMVTTKMMVSEIKDLILRNYILPTDDEPHYIIPKNRSIEVGDLLRANRWNIVADNCEGNDALYSDNQKYIYPGDEYCVEKYNSSASEQTQFKINTVPYPYQGNPLNAKVIILSLNPGYIPRVNHYFAKILQHYPQLAEGIMCFMRENLKLNVNTFLPQSICNSDVHPNYQDAYNMLGDWYWYDILSKWRNEGLTDVEIFSNVALIQFIPYSSEKAKDLHKDCILPSQLFAKKLIMYIAETSDTLFIVPRAVTKWKTLLGNTWLKLEREGRLIIGRNPLCQHLSSNNLGYENYRHIIEHLKSKLR